MSTGYYIKQNAKIIKSLIGNIDRLSQEIIDYVANLAPVECEIWKGAAPVRGGTIVRIFRKTTKEGEQVLEFIVRNAANQQSVVSYSDLRPPDRIKMALLVHSVFYYSYSDDDVKMNPHAAKEHKQGTGGTVGTAQ